MDIGRAIGWGAPDDVIAHNPADSPRFGVVALDVEVVGEPIHLPGDVVVHVGEPECLEPARGSWAEVSERVPAVHDHRAGPVEHGDALLVERS